MAKVWVIKTSDIRLLATNGSDDEDHLSAIWTRFEIVKKDAVEVGQAFNPFSLFDGALVPSEILGSRDLLPSEKLVFARLLQFAGGNGKAWPSIERVANEVALSVPQARRCISSLEKSRRSVLWHAVTEPANAGTKLVPYRPALAKSGNRYRRKSSPRSSR